MKNAWGGKEMCTDFRLENIMRRNHLRDQNMAEKVNTKTNSKEKLY
jgi:hypothetical protein